MQALFSPLPSDNGPSRGASPRRDPKGMVSIAPRHKAHFNPGRGALTPSLPNERLGLRQKPSIKSEMVSIDSNAHKISPTSSYEQERNAITHPSGEGGWGGGREEEGEARRRRGEEEGNRC